MSEIPWLDMYVTFHRDHVDEAVARIRSESLGLIDAEYGENGVLRQAVTANIKLHASLAFVDLFEKMPGYVSWNSAKKACVCHSS